MSKPIEASIVVVDDEPSIRELLVASLHFAGFEVNTAASGSEAIEVIERLQPDLIVLAGFLVVIPAEMIAKYRNRMINIHPSLIPAFCGTGFYGLKVHEKALERGVKVVGATVHFVDEGTDTGPIILQKAVEVEQGDTPEVLQRRVMEQAEWRILPRAIDLIANGKVKVEGHRVTIES